MPGIDGVGVMAGELQLDVTVEQCEALLAADLRPAGPEEPLERFCDVRTVHQRVLSNQSGAMPLPVRSARSLRRASCRVL